MDGGAKEIRERASKSPPACRLPLGVRFTLAHDKKFETKENKI